MATDTAKRESSRWVTDEAHSGIQGRIEAINESLDKLQESLYPALEQGSNEEAMPDGGEKSPDADTRAPLLVMLSGIHGDLNKINYRIQGLTNRVTL